MTLTISRIISKGDQRVSSIMVDVSVLRIVNVSIFLLYLRVILDSLLSSLVLSLKNSSSDLLSCISTFYLSKCTMG